jgi:hypothetical protein
VHAQHFVPRRARTLAAGCVTQSDDLDGTYRVHRLEVHSHGGPHLAFPEQTQLVISGERITMIAPTVSEGAIAQQGDDHLWFDVHEEWSSPAGSVAPVELRYELEPSDGRLVGWASAIVELSTPQVDYLIDIVFEIAAERCGPKSAGARSRC